MGDERIRNGLVWGAGAAITLGVASLTLGEPQDEPEQPPPPSQEPAAPEHVAPEDLPTPPDPNGTDETSGRMAEDLARTTFVAPVFRADGENGVGIKAHGPPLLPEGSFLADRRGILVPVGDKDWGFVFDKDAKGDAERPMLLGRCLRLAEMVRLRASRDRTATFVVSGRVMIYHSVNVLMPEEARLVSTQDEGEKSATESDAILSANRTLDPDSGEPSIDDLLARIEKARGDQDRGLGTGAVEEAAAQARGDLLPEGTMIVSQRGRVVRGAKGHLAFVREGDTGGLVPSGRGGGGEMVLARCQNLEAIERLWQGSGDKFALTVSGTVTVFEGENILVPLMFVVEPRRGGELTSAQ